MSLFAIADLHLSLGEDKPMDIFAGWDNYVERLTKNWNTLVTDDDTVMIAGDISWAMKLEQTYTDFKYIDDLGRVAAGYAGWSNFSRYITIIGGEPKVKLKSSSTITNLIR